MNQPGDGCNLECLQKNKKKGLPQVHEFIGPVKILLVDTPPSVYRYKCYMTALINLVYFCMGAVVMTIAFYCVTYYEFSFQVSHIFMSTVGWQLLIPSGILSMNPFNGAAAVMKLPHRKLEHSISTAVGYCYAVTGAVFSVIQVFRRQEPISDFISIHSGLGFVAICIGLVATICGPLSYFSAESKKDWLNTVINYLKASHMILGVASFACSTACFITGIIRPVIRFWLPQQHMLYILILFAVYYTLVVCASPVVRWMEEQDKKRNEKLSELKMTK